MAVLNTTGGDGAITSELLGISDFPFTIAAWVRSETVKEGIIAGFGNNTSSRNFHDAALWDLSGNLRGYIRSRYNNQVPIPEGSTLPNLSLNTWYPIVCTWPSTTLRRVYSVALENSGSNSTAVTGFTHSTDPINRFAVGRVTFDNTTRPFDGQIAHVAVWNKQLSNAEITAFMNGDNPLTIANEEGNQHLRAYWGLDFFESSGKTYWKDLSVNAYDLELLSAATADTTTSPPLVDDPPSNNGITITGIKEPNEADTLVVSVSSPRVKVWNGTDDSGAENTLFENEGAIYPITNGTLEVPLAGRSIDDVVTVEVMWTVGTERKLFIAETTVVDIGSGS